MEAPLKGQYLEYLSWDQAEVVLQRNPIVMLPLGARLKEHGHHLPLNNDWIMAEYFCRRVLERFPVVALPTLQHGYYPAFTEYPGSVHITRETSTRTVVDIARSMGQHGCEKFYVLNTGISTLWALEPARLELQGYGVHLEYTNLFEHGREAREAVREQTEGTHADEIETSMMLYIAPEIVDMERATASSGRTGPGPLTRKPGASRGVYSPSGVFGDATLASREKGEVVVEAIVEAVVAQIEAFAAADFTPRPPDADYLSRR